MAAKKNSPKKKLKPTKSVQKKKSSTRVSANDRENIIRKAAYYRAEKNGFAGDSCKYWVDAEKEIDAQHGDFEEEGSGQ